MAWLCVDKDGTEVVCSEHPILLKSGMWSTTIMNEEVELPTGTIKKIIGRELTWSDDPVEIK